MTASSKHEVLVLKSWSLLHRVRDVLQRCEEEKYGQYGLTPEQYGVLVTIKYVGQSARITDIARWSARSPNSVSMIVDRMVKIGLVKRVRDKHDRRVVFVSVAPKGEKALGPATTEGLGLIQTVMKPLMDDDLAALIKLLEAVRSQAVGCLNQEVAAEEMGKDDVTAQADFRQRLRQYIGTSTTESSRKSDRKTKPTRRR
jgi:MarR family transcriptional regulator, 2-MHQ and catechol-resistance regulon repressor